MIMSDKEIWAAQGTGSLNISPFNRLNVQPASYDITLGDTYSEIAGNVNEKGDYIIIIPEKEVKYRTFNADRYILMPGQFILATTKEHIKLGDKITAFVEGRTSWGRLGLFIQNAGWVDPGFEGNITLQMFNASHCPIELRAGLRIGQLVFAKMDEPCVFPYNGKYQGQIGATGSKVYKDFEKENINYDEHE